MAFGVRMGGTKFSPRALFDGLEDELIQHAIGALATQVHGRASSVVDPDSGKHVPVIVRQVGGKQLSIHAAGSAAFKRALEDRLGLCRGEVRGMNDGNGRPRLVYLAHGSEDKAVALPLAEGLMKLGIDVWYDNWEIGIGDSLRRKMEAGLGNCTHFIVLLTKTSIAKPWVNEEIDVGLMNAVEGTAKFMGLRYQLDLSAVPSMLRTRLTPEFKPDQNGLEALAAEILEVSRKPALGETPHYLKNHIPGSSWSASARVVAEYFVRNSESGRSMDPQANYIDIQSETGLPMPDVRIGVLDLLGAGLLEKQDYVGGHAHIGPKADLFVVFDGDFMDWLPENDARNLAVHLHNLGEEHVDATPVAEALGWPPRRFNPAAAYLASARVVEAIEYLSGDSYWPSSFVLGDELLRYVRSL